MPSPCLFCCCVQLLALQWASNRAAGVTIEPAYPYAGVTQTCPSTYSKAYSRLNTLGAVAVDLSTYDGLFKALMRQPLAITIWADSNDDLSFYGGGVYSPNYGGGQADREDHAVTLVGWGQERLKNGSYLPFWLIKNSWSSDWWVWQHGSFSAEPAWQAVRAGGTCSGPLMPDAHAQGREGLPQAAAAAKLAAGPVLGRHLLGVLPAGVGPQEPRARPGGGRELGALPSAVYPPRSGARHTREPQPGVPEPGSCGLQGQSCSRVQSP